MPATLNARAQFLYDQLSHADYQRGVRGVYQHTVIPGGNQKHTIVPDIGTDLYDNYEDEIYALDAADLITILEASQTDIRFQLVGRLSRHDHVSLPSDRLGEDVDHVQPG